MRPLMFQTPIVELSGVSFRYPNGVVALSDISMALDAGEIVSIVGPSGCGKSTLLNVIAGLLPSSSGLVRIDGSTDTNRRGRFSFMPQKDLLLPWRSALDNAGLLLEVAGADRRSARRRALEMLGEFGLDGFHGEWPSRLSGGMKQRIALIRTFLPGRDVLLDEPFGALDAITRADLHQWLMELQRKTGQAALLVTHDVEEALLLSHRVHVMSPRPGRVVATVPISFPYPRSGSLVSSAEFATLRAETLGHLRAAIAGNGDTSWAA